MQHKTTIIDLDTWGVEGESPAIYQREMVISNNGNSIAVRPMLHDSQHKGHFGIFVYDTTGKLICSTKNPNGGEQGLAFWPDESHLLMPGHNPTGMKSGKGPSALKLWRLGNNSFSFPFLDTELHGSGSLTDLQGVSKTGRYVISAYKFYDTHTNTFMDVQYGNYVFSADDGFVTANQKSDPRYTSSVGGYVLDLIKLKTWSHIWHGNEFCLTFSPDCRFFVTSEYDSELCIHSTDSPDSVQVIHKQYGEKDDFYTAAEYKPDSRILFTGSRQGHLYVWDINNQTCLERIENAHPYPITQMKFSATKDELITTDNERIIVWQL